MTWTLDEEKQLFIVYLEFRSSIVKGEYPSEYDFNDFVRRNNLKHIQHPFKSSLMRIKNIAACDVKVKHENVLNKAATQTKNLAKIFFVKKDGQDFHL